MDIVDSIKKGVVEMISDIPLEQITEIVQRNTHSLINRARVSLENRRELETRRRIESLKNYYSRPPIYKQTPMQAEENLSVTTESRSSINSTISNATSNISLDDECFYSQPDIQIHKDSISEYQLKDNQIQLTINHEHKRNFLNVTLHRVKITSLSSDIKQIFARVYLMPGKIQKQNSKSIRIDKASRWEHDFIFKKLTIGQLEDCSIRVQIISKNGVLKVPVLIGRVEVHLRDVNLSDFRTTRLMLERDI